MQIDTACVGINRNQTIDKTSHSKQLSVIVLNLIYCFTSYLTEKPKNSASVTTLISVDQLSISDNQ